jgi:uncharacterized protein (TIGR00290 family)
MDSKKKVTISWSGGKDSAFALFKILASGEYEVVNLHTILDKETKRVGLHGVREALIEEQASRLGFPLVKLYLDASDDHQVYASLMKSFYKICAQDGLDAVVFGDIFLADLREFRESLLNQSGLSSLFPLWEIDSRTLLDDFIAMNFKTLICAADASLFSSDQIGKVIDRDYVQTFPDGVDYCGERGEYHTFVFDGPLFKNPATFNLGEVVKKSYRFGKKDDDGNVSYSESAFWFQDLLPLTIS